MTYPDDAGADMNDSAVGPVHSTRPPDSRAPVHTDFTTTDVPAWQQGAHTPDASELGLVRSAKVIPRHGWRKAVHSASGGTVNPGESAADSRVQALADRVNQRARGSHSIAVLSLKGGVGKTTTTVGLGATLASSRGDRVVAVDANPDFGTLDRRGPKQTQSTVRGLLADRHIVRYSDIRRHTSQSSSRLEILASDRDPAVSQAFSEDDYRAVHEILDRFYSIILTDCGTGLTHSAIRGVLDTADALVVAASLAIDSARSALATLDWLQHHGYVDLVSNASVVLSSPRPGATLIDLEQMTAAFVARGCSVFVIPYDHHLAEGGEISLDLMSRKTRQAYMQLAARMADAFGRRSARGAAK